MNLRKVNRHVDFPLLLDLAPFCSATCKVLIGVINVSKDHWFMNPYAVLIKYSCVWQNLGSGERVLYSLYGIVEHSGSMRGGHYAAYVKVRTPQRKPEQRRNQSGTKPPRQHIASMCLSICFYYRWFWKAWIICGLTKGKGCRHLGIGPQPWRCGLFSRGQVGFVCCWWSIDAFFSTLYSRREPTFQQCLEQSEKPREKLWEMIVCTR